MKWLSKNTLEQINMSKAFRQQPPGQMNGNSFTRTVNPRKYGGLNKFEHSSTKQPEFYTLMFQNSIAIHELRSQYQTLRSFKNLNCKWIMPQSIRKVKNDNTFLVLKGSEGR